MTVPIAPYVTWQELREQLEQQGCRFEMTTFQDQARETVTITTIRRDLDEELTSFREYQVKLDDHDRVEPSIVRSLCAALNLQPRTFGFSFGGDVG